LNTLDEETLAKLMHWELNGQRRFYVINRIKSRHNRLRDMRERTELLGDLNVGK
jgi:hypothetical protein